MVMCVCMPAFFIILDEGESVELTIEPTQLTVLLFTGRERVNLTCTASSSAVEIMWSINTTLVTSDVAEVTTSVVDNKKVSMLTLKRPSPNLSGRYDCFIPLLISDTFSTVRITGKYVRVCVCMHVHAHTHMCVCITALCTNSSDTPYHNF